MSVKNAKRIVFKVGTSTLMHKNGKPSYKKLERLVRVIAELMNSDKEIILVSSGAVAVGVDCMHLAERPKETVQRQALAAVGQCELMFIYDKLFSQYNKVVGQILLTRNAINMPDRQENIKNTFDELIKMGAIPIVNENDTVATDELAYTASGVFGDNDTLSAMVAEVADADLLVLVTDKEGLFDRDPSLSDAQLISVVDEITPELLTAAGGSESKFGTGGMHTKLLAAQTAQSAGIDTVIISGKDINNIYDLFEGKQIGTHIRA